MKRFLIISLIICVAIIVSSTWSLKQKAQVLAPQDTEREDGSSIEIVEVQQDVENPGYERGVLLVKFTPLAARSLLLKLSTGDGADTEMLLPASLNEFAAKYNVTSLEPLFNPALVSPAYFNQVRARFAQRSLRSRQHKLPRLDHIFKMRLDRQADLEQAASELSLNPVVLFAEPNRFVQVTFTPNDQYYNTNDLWGLFKIQAATAWDTARGNGVKVAVIDTGIDLSHSDLQANIWVNTGEISNDNIDNDNNGYIDDVNGWDFAYNDKSPTDAHGHGTHVAGTIGAVGNNTHGVVGLAFESKLMPVKGLNDSGQGSTAGLANALLYAINNGADVINNSWGGPDDGISYTTVRQIIDTAHGLGVVTVSAAGNNNAETCSFCPANLEKSIAVSAFKNDDTRASFSNFGVKVDVAAPGGDSGTLTPGTDILSTAPLNSFLANSGVPILTGSDNRKYMAIAGTSMAAPHVSALTALLIQAHPTWTNEEIRQAIRQSANDVATVGFDTDSGYGRINATNALALAATPPPVASVEEPVNCSYITGTVPVKGFSTFTSGTYSVAVGAGNMPASFIPVSSSNTSIFGGLLTNLNTHNFPDGQYTIRLLTNDTSTGKTAEDRNFVTIDNVFISSPTEGEYLASSSFTVKGKASGNLGFINYNLQWAAGCNATTGFTTIVNSTTPMNTVGPLGNWNLSGVPDGQITLRLTASFSGGGVFTSQDQKCVTVDKLLAPGWPVAINHVPSFKSPKIADLDGDGTNEIVLGASVFEPNGSLRAGWNNFPGMGRTNPAILNVDNNNDLEVVAAVFDNNNASPNGGAPIIYAYKPNKSVLWSYTVQNPNSPNFNYGIPSSISAADVDADGMPEIVFTMFFTYNNPNVESRVFVLDATNGALQTSFAVPGIAISSVALADMDGIGATDIVVVSRINGSNTGVFSVVNGSGAPLSGWPVQIPAAADTSGFGNADPVVADADLDGQLEILAGKHLLNYDGTAKSGWPTIFLSRSTGVMVPLPDADCQMEALTGAGNSLVFAAFEHSGGLKFFKPNTFENLFVIMIGENGIQGNPVVADIDGDQQVEIIRPGELGSTTYNKPIPLYGSEGVSSSSPPGFSRFVLSNNSAGWSDPIRSTAAVGDVDKDGKVDLLIAAGGRIYYWNLQQPYRGNLSYWPMFQHDLRNTGLTLSSTVSDIYMQDAPTDVGNEPNSNNTGSEIWGSPDLWNCQTSPTCTSNQNPEYRIIGFNYMRVRIRNRGCAASRPAKIRLYWTRARTNETWDIDWVNSGGGTAAEPLGNEITTGGGLTIPSIPAGGSIILTNSWQPPNPLWNGYQLTGVDWQGYPMICLLARIESAGDPMLAESFGPIVSNVFNNNNIVTRNTYVTDLTPGRPASEHVTVMVRNPTQAMAYANLTLAPERSSTQPPFHQYGELTLALEPNLWNSWAAGGFRGYGFTISGTREIRITDARGARLEGIQLGPGERAQVGVRFRLTVFSPVIDGRQFKFLLTQSHEQPNERPKIDGVVTFEINTSLSMAPANKR